MVIVTIETWTALSTPRLPDPWGLQRQKPVVGVEDVGQQCCRVIVPPATFRHACWGLEASHCSTWPLTLPSLPLAPLTLSESVLSPGHSFGHSHQVEMHLTPLG